MKATRYIILLLLGLLLTTSAQAQITVYRDSTSFDDAFARLREVDFEDVYSATAGLVTFRNPWGLNCYGFENPELADSIDNYLLLGQGATLDFPTRTRRVVLEGYGNAVEVWITDFNDSIFMVPLDSFPLDLVHDAGLKRIQLLGRDPFSGEYDINWRMGLRTSTIFDEAGDTLGFTDFEELEPDHYYILNQGFSSIFFEADSLMDLPVELHGITVTEPYLGFGGTFLSEWEAHVDPDNPIGNLAVELTTEGAIDFAPGTEGAMVVLEAVRPEDTLWFEVSDYAGAVDTVMQAAAGHPLLDSMIMEDQQMTWLQLGFGSTAGIRRVRLIGTTSFMGSVLLGSVHLAETPRSEIVMIDNAVRSLEGVGFLADVDAAPLAGKLAAAIADVERNDRQAAIERLESFRNDVAAMAARRALMMEEAKLFSGDAAYVIGRLGGAAAGVEESRDGDALDLLLAAPIRSGDAMELRFNAPAASHATIAIHDIRGALIRTLEPSSISGGHGAVRWDLRDGAGNPLPAGSYLIALHANGRTATRLVQLTR